VNRRNWLLLVLAGIVFSSLGILLASAMLFPHSDQLDLPYARGGADHPPCDAGYNTRYNMPFQFSPYGYSSH